MLPERVESAIDAHYDPPAERTKKGQTSRVFVSQVNAFSGFKGYDHAHRRRQTHKMRDLRLRALKRISDCPPHFCSVLQLPVQPPPICAQIERSFFRAKCSTKACLKFLDRAN